MSEQFKKLDELPPGYYDAAEKSGNKVQMFWHRQRFQHLVRGVDLKNRRVLDVGCGCGNFIDKIKESTDFCVGIDAAIAQVNYANAKFKNEKTAFVEASADSIPYPDEHFDLIFCSELIEHLLNPEEVIKEMKRLLKASGELIMTTPNYSSFWPVLELVWNKVSKVDYYHQHITKFNKKKLEEALNREGFKSSVKTFYVISPFLSLVSGWLAEKVMRLEERLFPNKGMLLISKSIKE